MDNRYLAVQSEAKINKENLKKLAWLFGDGKWSEEKRLKGFFIGPRQEMVTPWSTNAVDITRNMGIEGIERIEEFWTAKKKNVEHDPMLQKIYEGLDQDIFKVEKKPEPIIYIKDIKQYNKQEGLALNKDEIEYLEDVSKKLKRKLTDSEVFGFSQVNSEHCRHKIFNGTFIIDGKEKKESLFDLIKKTTKLNHNRVVSAYKDNAAILEGPIAEQFAPKTQEKSSFFETKKIKTDITLKAETHNFPTTVEPFYGASTGAGGEIRDRMGCGKAGTFLAGTAVYMTSYPRLDGGRSWEENLVPRKWLYQSPEEILIKASNGASDFGNKFGQPLICGSVLTFEHQENNKQFGYDKVVMLGGGIGLTNAKDSLKELPHKGDKIVMLGGDNYRIGMGGGAVSSVATGEYEAHLELNAVQRANPEMQKRVYNVIRAMSEDDKNPIISIHDHGAGGHLNCFSELVEETGGVIDIDKLPVGDNTLSAKEIIGNESQERMGLVIKEKDLAKLARISERERAPMYVVGEVSDDKRFLVEDEKGNKPMDLKLEHMFGKPPKTVLEDDSTKEDYKEVVYDAAKIEHYLEQVLQLEAVACKDWLTNKVDRCVTGKVARQQTIGPVQLPLSDVAVMAVDYKGKKGVATAVGHASVAGLIDAAAGSRLSMAEALTNIVWAPIEKNLKGVSLSANWMWPAKNKGENARLYEAVKAVSDFAVELGINIPTGKDSLSMTQKYGNGDVVYSPGTVIVSAMGEVSDIRKVITPLIVDEQNTSLIYVDLSKDEFKLGGSCFAQVNNKLGKEVPTVKDGKYFKKVFEAIQALIKKGQVLAGHDISAGGMITTLLEMCFARNNIGLDIDLSKLVEKNLVKILFSENPGVILQVKEKDVTEFLAKKKIDFCVIGKLAKKRGLKIKKETTEYKFDIDKLRDIWFQTSHLLDTKQCGEEYALKRFVNYPKQELKFKFNKNFKGDLSHYKSSPSKKEKPKAAIIREQGVNGDREIAYDMYLAGFEVKDIHMTDLIAGREDLKDVNFIVFPGGFANSDVLGSAKGWAGSFIYNEKAKKALADFYKRKDTLSLGVCNGCQTMVHLGLIYPEHKKQPRMLQNKSGKFECAFLSVEIPKNNSVMLKFLAGSKLGVWVAHGEGQFSLPYEESKYHIPLKYGYADYPANPNGAQYNVAALCSEDGRHLAMMPHLERTMFPWNWAYYPEDRKKDEVSPWFEAFVKAKEWVENFQK